MEAEEFIQVNIVLTVLESTSPEMKHSVLVKSVYSYFATKYGTKSLPSAPGNQKEKNQNS